MFTATTTDQPQSAKWQVGWCPSPKTVRYLEASCICAITSTVQTALFFYLDRFFRATHPSLPINCKGRRHMLFIFIRISLSFFFQEERTVCNCCWIHVFVHMTFIHFVVESNFCTFCRLTSFDCDIHILIVVEFGCFYGIFLFTQN